MASLHVVRGHDNGRYFLLRGTLVSIGRDSGNQVQLRDSEVSRQHAKIFRIRNGEYELVDNSSSNGTHVNGTRIERHFLRSGDRIQIGRSLLIYTAGPDPKRVHLLESTAEFQQATSHGEQESDVDIVAEKPEELSHIIGRLNSPSNSLGVSLDLHRKSSQDPSLSRATFESAPTSGDELFPSNGNPHDAIAEDNFDSSSALRNASDWDILDLVGQAITRTVDLQELLARVFDLIFDWIQCDRGCVMLVDDMTGQLFPACSRWRSQPKNNSRLAISQTILDHVLEQRQGVLISNAQDDSRWVNAESIVNMRVHEAVCVPMLGKFGNVGAIYVDTELSPGKYAQQGNQPQFRGEHLRLMMAVATQAALAIEDTQFYRAMMQSERLAAMGQTIANLSHHVKNILQGVKGGAYLVDDGIAKGKLDVVQKGWQIVQRNQYRISHLVLDMLSFSKEREPELVSGNLCELVRDVVELMRPRATELGIKMICDGTNSPVEACFDNEALHRALLNVITNAIDAASHHDDSNHQAEVRIRCGIDQATDQACVVVEDSGEGIAPEDLERIFSPFESSKGARGTGLGLPVSRKILREHGGDITVTSQIGTGSEFVLRWPRVPENPSAG